MEFTVADMIKRAGGVEKIAEASGDTDYPITADAAHKWRKNGVPEVHWPLFIRMAGVSVEDIFTANKAARQEKCSGSVPKRRATSAAA